MGSGLKGLIYVFMHVCFHVCYVLSCFVCFVCILYVYICIFIFMYICMCVYIYVSRICIFVCVYIYICIFICASLCVCFGTNFCLYKSYIFNCLSCRYLGCYLLVWHYYLGSILALSFEIVKLVEYNHWHKVKYSGNKNQPR